MKPDENILKQFNLEGKVEFLPGGESRTYKVNNVVLKYLNKDSEKYTIWIADLYSTIKENGFRVPKPIQNNDHKWITSDGWSASKFLEGSHNYKNNIESSISAIIAFHKAIKDFPKPEFLGKEDSPYMQADKYTWEEKPEKIHPELKELVESLYAIKQPVFGLKDQIIHGDLNPDNILISDSLPPAIIDIAPYFRPPEFALAIYAYWIAAWRNEPELLTYFKNVKEFDQMLIRAGIRMLLIMSEFNKVNNLEKYKKATEIILSKI